MAGHKVFTSEDQKMEFYINDKKQLFIHVGDKQGDDFHYTGFITLKKADVQELIADLTKLVDEVAN